MTVYREERYLLLTYIICLTLASVGTLYIQIKIDERIEACRTTSASSAANPVTGLPSAPIPQPERLLPGTVEDNGRIEGHLGTGEETPPPRWSYTSALGVEGI